MSLLHDGNLTLGTDLPTAGASSGGARAPAPAIYRVTNNASPAALGSFSYFPVYVLDYNDGAVLFPGADQVAKPGSKVDLRAQVRDTTVASYSWNTSGLSDADGATISGTGTYRLQFQWLTSIFYANTDTATLTVTDVNGHQEVQTYSFAVLPSAVIGSGMSGGGAMTWPEALAPNLLRADAPWFGGHNAAVDANSGAVDATVPLPAYNPNVPALALSYDSLVADPRPIVVEHHVLDDALEGERGHSGMPRS